MRAVQRRQRNEVEEAEAEVEPDPGTGLAPPNVKAPLEPKKSSAGSTMLIQGSMWGMGLRVTRPST